MRRGNGGDGGRLPPRALAVVRHLLTHGPSTRAALGELLGLSDASMSRMARTLVDAGVVTERAERTADPVIGRPRRILTAVPGSRHVVGVKLTGDTAHGVLCDLGGTVIGSLDLPLPLPLPLPSSARTRGAVPVDGTVQVIGRLVRELGARAESVHGLGISLGGVVDGRAVVREGTFLGWRDVELGTLVSGHCGLPTVLTNDVAGLAREQLWFGAGRTHDTFGVITVGAGVGLAVVREGVVLEQLIDNGHLLAHAPVDSSGPACRLGHRGCVAAYLDREDVAARLGLRGTEVTAGRLTALDPDWPAGASRALGHLIATVAGGLQTERIVLAGEDAALLYGSPVTGQTLRERLRSSPVRLEVSTGPLTFTDWARGAGVAGIQGILGAL
ncbi:ROK family transcriptional regulator [Kineosporia sp. J2-2]|uniref:ROK family transcriptional regulator n=1 Tax=Kineosporia corallincola TaxID=2835133 RepID=A0ABS5TBP9_9ACTN|nr:ROK family transcriptional regulator [Kineosporia corallincola]MBT0768495.1 ROK family transcriptional regulator [Kineosporia corallincola]